MRRVYPELLSSSSSKHWKLVVGGLKPVVARWEGGGAHALEGVQPFKDEDASPKDARELISSKKKG